MMQDFTREAQLPEKIVDRFHGEVKRTNYLSRFAMIAALMFLCIPSWGSLPLGNILDNLGLSSGTPGVAVFSLRKLSSYYSGNALKIRRSSDDATTTIGFDSNGYLDTATLKTFCAGTNGYAVSWYDQSSNGYTASQSTSSLQPRIVLNGIIDRRNGQPALYLDGTTYMVTSSFNLGNFTVSIVGGVTTNSSFSTFCAKTNDNRPACFDMYNNSFLLGNGSSFDSKALTVPIDASSGFSQWTFAADATQAGAWRNGASNLTVTSAVSLGGNSPFYIGTRADYATHLVGYVSEFVLFASVLSTIDRTTMENNQKNWYEIVIPVVSAVSPLMGYPSSSATITGTGFNSTAASNVVYFGATKAAVTAASTTSLTVTVPTSATYARVSVTNTSNALTGYAQYPFMPTFNNSAFAPGIIGLASQATINSNGGGYGMATGDLDGDGKPEIVYSEYNNGRITIYKNTSASGSINSGSFASGVNFSTGSNPYFVAIGDLDGDGKPDLVVINLISNTISLLRNVSTGGTINGSSFESAVNFTCGSSANGIAIGDIDQDGKADIAISNSTGAISVYRNTTTGGTFTSASLASPYNFFASSYSRMMVIGDLDGDGKPELVSANVGSNSIAVFKNTGSAGTINSGTFANPVYYTAGSSTFGIAMGDIDGDGKQDLVAGNSGDNTISVFRNTCTGSVINEGSFAAKQDFATQAGPYMVTIGDLDGDGKPDIACTNFNSASVSIFRNTATSGVINSGSLGARTDYATGNNPWLLAICDMDGDGKSDVVTTNVTSANFSILRNNPIAPITGTGTICQGATLTLGDLTTGGTWSSSNTALATVGSTTGIVTGTGAGTVVISYIASGSVATTVVTVTASPATAVTTSLGICRGSSAPLTATGATTYSWMPATALSATTGANVTATPFATTTYTVTGTLGSCTRTASVTVSVNAAAAAISVIGKIGYINTIAGNGSFGFVGDNGAATAASLKYPLAVAADASGNIYISDNNSARIRKVSNTGIITTIAGTGTNDFSGDGGSATAAALNQINGVAASADGTVYIADQGNHRIRMISTSGIVSTIAGNGSATNTGDNGPATAATISYPSDVAVDAAGNIYIASSNSGRIRKINTSGIITTVAGASGGGPAGDGGPATAAHMSPYRVAVDAAGNIYIAEQGAGVIRKVDIATGIINRIAGTGATSFNGETGAATAINLNNPSGLAVDASGNVYINDASNSRIRKVDMWGNISTIEGDGSFTFSGDGGPATAAQSAGVQGLGMDSRGNLLMAENGSNRIRKITLAADPITVCLGTTTTLSNTATGGTWSSNATSVATIDAASGIMNAIAAGVATISYTMPGGCFATTIVTVNALPEINAGFNIPICAGTSTTLTATGGVSYSWSPAAALSATTGASVIATPSENAIFTVTGTDANGCANTANVTVFVVPIPTVSGGADVAVCNDSVAILTATGASEFSWSPASGLSATTGSTVIASPSVTTTYTVTGTTTASTGVYSVGCSSTATVKVTENVLLSSALSTNVSCFGGSDGTTSMTASGNGTSFSYLLIPGGFTTPSVVGLPQGIYIARVTDNNGCMVDNVVTITQPTPLVVSMTSNSPVCAGSDLSFTGNAFGGTGIKIYRWIGPNGFLDPMQNPVITAATTAATGVYTLTVRDANACTALASSPAIVNPLPAIIDGNYNVCLGLNTTLSNSTPGGTWTSSDDATASVSADGTVTGNATGTAIIAYTLPTGCITTANVSVNAFPAAITGFGGICAGNTATLSDATEGGSWSSSNPAVASVNAATGVVTSGATAGSVMITYTSNRGCSVTTPELNPIADITGTNGTCIGLTTTLASATPGGTWSSSNTAVATVGTSGIVSALTGGNTTITYATTGCYRTQDMTMSTTPAPITGAGEVCVGNMLTVSDANTGGTWTCVNPALVTLTTLPSGDATVAAVAAGTTNITYSLSATCKIAVPVTVNPLPATISGTLKVCPGTTTTLTNTTAGGSWISANTSVAAIDAATGVVTGVSAGTSLITYMLPTSCIRTAVVTINPLPAAITGTFSTCAGSTTTLSDPTPAGLSWTSSNTGVAAINVTSGVVTGISAGTATITYMVSTGCQITTDVTINALPATIAGTLKICNGLTTTLTNTSTGGLWNSSNTTVATIDASGIATGLAAGTTTITYTLGTGCIKTTVLTVTPLPAAITGSMNICQGATGTLADAGGGTWASDNTSVATVNGTNGITTGVMAGTANITYTINTGCIATTIVTINPLPGAISGSLAVCPGSSSTLSSATTGGVWTSSNTSYVAAGSTSGVITGLASGTARITYTIATGCIATAVATVNPLPAAIAGVTGLCSGFTVTLSDATAGGTWSSSDTATAAVSSTGIVTGGTPGTATITYTSAAGCAATTTVTVSTLAAITGSGAVCAGSKTTLSDATAGGTWSSGATAIATVGTDGVVTGVGAGTATISYTFSGFSTSTVVTVMALPAAITGTATMCVGSAVTLADATTGGTWNSSVNAAVSPAGVVTGITAGTAIVTYTAGTGCTATKVVTVTATPDVITGSLSNCIGSVTTLSNTVAGGVWSSSFTSIVSIGSASGSVTSLAAGTAIVTYTAAGGCKATAALTVNATPPAITGTTKACPGTTTTLVNAAGGGTWSSNNTGVATIDINTGIVTGVAAGVATIDYTSVAGCNRTTTVTINPTPAAITGAMSICTGSTTALADATSGGLSWVSSNTAVATVNISSGLVTGVAVGTSTITYTLGTGCAITAVVSINALPTAIAGTLKVCAGVATTLTGGAGTWSSSNTAVATIGSTTGIAVSTTAGTTVITYSEGGGCNRTAVLTVTPTPATITGAATTCLGATTTLGETVSGGTWVSDNTAVATIGSANGIVTGTGIGNANITYALSTGCSTTRIVTINTSPSPTTGISQMCMGDVTTMSNATAGGTWSSSNPALATIGSLDGVVTTLYSTGTINITYTTGITGCKAIKPVTINPIPVPITGNMSVCQGAVTTLSSSGNGTWTSSNNAVGSIYTITVVSGRLTGLTTGTTVITYAFATGCLKTAIVTVNATPNAGAITSSGGFNINTVSAPTSVTLSATGDAGGAWTSSNTAKATVNSASGLVSSVAAGTATITYSVTAAGCTATATQVITVTAARAAGGNTATAANATTQISIYPNPTKGIINVNTADAGTFSIYAVDGKEIGTYTVASGITAITLPNGTAAGIYLCRYTGDNGNVATVRIVVE